jgi:methionyl-tRNA formyltransferase
MKKISEPIVFFGSGPVAAASLELLLQDFEIEAVITKPRPAHHKGPVPVLELAEKHRLTVLTAGSKSELDSLFETRPVRARLSVLIDFGIIVSESVIDYFELGIVNSHFSLLPEWRGADPITFSILSGQSKTGVSLMLLTAGMDEGPLLAQAEYEIEPGTTTPELTNGLIELSHQALVTVLPLYASGQTTAQPQSAVTLADSPDPTYSRKLTKADGRLDPTKPVARLEREIRAFIEWPRSRITLNDIDVIVTRARAIEVPTQATPGSFEVLRDPLALLLYCVDGYLYIERLQPSGKKEMSTDEFIRGYGQRLGLE